MRALILITALFLVCGCQEQKAPINQSAMAAILADLHLAEALGQLNPIDSGGYMIKNRDSIYTHYQYIFDNHQISTQQFSEALDWYGNEPTKFDEVYDLTLASLSTIKEENTIEPPTEIKPLDSAELAKRPVNYER